ncbi:MAG: 3-deoxy-7-phosphoheptulonate synthase [Pseudomonadota bacterium]
MKFETDDLRIREIKTLTPPQTLLQEYAVSDAASETVHASRETMRDILNGVDDRLAVVVGPCSIHDPEAAREYAQQLHAFAATVADDLFIVMRVYFEKPRTTVGWKGLINDPHLDDSFEINDGLTLARSLLLDLAQMGLPAGTEYLDLISPQYIADLVSWGAIGARTTESQSHRELASGLSCPIGFKNGTNGNLQIAVDAIGSASRPHHFLSVTKEGHSAIFATAGNSDCHVILRGGIHTNYDFASVDDAAKLLERSGLPSRIMIDCSHANSRKQFDRQKYVARDISNQLSDGDRRITGVMIESNLVSGNQKLVDGVAPVYGQSITDACIDWGDTQAVLQQLASAVRARRSANRATD